jgi:hypothetical protein
MNDKNVPLRMNSSLQKCKRNQCQTITQSGNKTRTSLIILWFSVAIPSMRTLFAKTTQTATRRRPKVPPLRQCKLLR